jgi:YgiT-type zinc finger domain-containing protein
LDFRRLNRRQDHWRDRVTFAIKTCPTCDSTRIRRVRRTLKRSYEGHAYSVPSVEFHHCPDCGEELFDSAAIEKIQSRSPAFAAAKGGRGRAGLKSAPTP